MRKIVLFFAYGFGLGKIPIAPATFGSLLGIPIFLLTQQNIIVYLAITAVITILGIYIADIAEKETKTKDNRKIVIDEVAGFLITMIGIPNSPFWIISGFLLFRILDIVKPPPLSWSQRLTGGIGIMMDDIFAGIIGCVILNISAKI